MGGLFGEQFDYSQGYRNRVGSSGILAGFGLMLLPLIVVIVIFSKVVVPFVVAFLCHFQ